MENTSPQLLASEEIYEALEKAALFGGKITQPSLDGSISSPIHTIGLYDGKVTFKLGQKISLDPEVHLLFDFSYRDLAFKIDGRQFTFNGSEISAAIPEEVKGIPRRINRRYALPLNNQELSLIQRIEKRGALGELNVRLIDISVNGLAVILSDAENDSILKNDHIWIKSLNNISLDKPIFGTVVYTSDRRYVDGKLDVKAGISLDSLVPEEVLEAIRAQSNLVLST